MEAMFQCEGVITSFKVISQYGSTWSILAQVACKDYLAKDPEANSPIHEALEYMAKSGQPIVGNTLKYDAESVQVVLRNKDNKFPHCANAELHSVKFKVSDDLLSATFTVGLIMDVGRASHLVETCMNAEESRMIEFVILDRPTHDLPSRQDVNTVFMELFPEDKSDEDDVVED